MQIFAMNTKKLMTYLNFKNWRINDENKIRLLQDIS